MLEDGGTSVEAGVQGGDGVGGKSRNGRDRRKHSRFRHQHQQQQRQRQRRSKSILFSSSFSRPNPTILGPMWRRFKPELETFQTVH